MYGCEDSEDETLGSGKVKLVKEIAFNSEYVLSCSLPSTET